ncbi:MAG: hypothetical protein Q9200_001259 [Gallowayella weberi]
MDSTKSRSAGGIPNDTANPSLSTAGINDHRPTETLQEPSLELQEAAWNDAQGSGTDSQQPTIPVLTFSNPLSRREYASFTGLFNADFIPDQSDFHFHPFALADSQQTLHPPQPSDGGPHYTETRPNTPKAFANHFMDRQQFMHLNWTPVGARYLDLNRHQQQEPFFHQDPVLGQRQVNTILINGAMNHRLGHCIRTQLRVI